MVLASLGSRDEKSSVSLTRFSSIEPRTPTSPQSPKDGLYSLPNDDDDVFADEKEVPKTYSSIVPPPPTPGTAPSLEFKKDWRRRKLSSPHVILIVLGVVLILGLAVGIALAIMFVHSSASTISAVSQAEAINYNGHLTLSTPWTKSLSDLEILFLNNVEIIINSSDLNIAFINSSFISLSNNRTLLYFTINFKKHDLVDMADLNVKRGMIMHATDQNSDVWLAQAVQQILRDQVVKNAVSITLPIVADSIVIFANIPVTSLQTLTTTSTISLISSTPEVSGLCQQMTFEPCHSQLNTSYFYLPNYFNHSLTQQATDAFAELSGPPSDLKCSQSAVLFLCSLLFPPCEESFLAPVQPCDTLCEVVKNGCGNLSKWPQTCSGFPQKNCVEPLAEVSVTTISSTFKTTVSTSATTASTTTSSDELDIQYDCVAILNFSICNYLGFYETPMPSPFFICDTIDCLKQEFEYFADQSIDSGCTTDYSFFCGYFFPGCDKKNSNAPILPCAESCVDTVSKCQDTLSYPPDCTAFLPQSQGTCIGPNLKPVFPEECIVQSYEFCSELGFTQTLNSSDFAENMTELIKVYETWALPTINSGCSTVSKFFYCGFFFPKCHQDGSVLFPCKKECEELSAQCPDAVFPLDCSTFEEDHCVFPRPTIPTTVTTVSPVTPPKPKQVFCEAMNFSLCTQFGYSLTAFPNFWGDASAEAAYKSYNKYAEPAVSAGCTSNILFFVCTMLFPFCEEGGYYKMPCRSFCEEVNKNCSELLFYQDCLSVSDPDPNKCFRAPERKVCSGTDFTCKLINNCVSTSALCNRKNDCGDWSDEWNCECNKDFEMKCNMGMCIPSYQRCDGEYQCPDNSDELNCTCKNNQYQCQEEVSKCIMPEWRCDGQKDCKNGDDEFNCATCSKDQFTCFDSKCIPLMQQCDGTPQCADHSDEMECIYRSDEESPLGVMIEKNLYYVCYINFTVAHGQTACHKLGDSEIKEFNEFYPDVMLNSQFGMYFQLDPSGNKHSVLGAGKLVERCERSAVKLDCIPKECGHPTPNLPSTIINGQNAVPGAWPWLVSLKKFNIHECGGAIIHPYFILTAGHCIDTYVDYNHAVVVAGATFLSKPGVHSTSYNIRRAILHPGYKRFEKNDMALIELRKPIRYNEYVKPICFPDKNDVFTKRNKCFIAGWGHTLNVKAPSDQMQQTKITLWDTNKCNGSFMWNGVMAENERCAGYYSGQIAACSGDSGSPVSCQDETGTYKSLGVISYVYKFCNGVERPMVFTLTAPFLDWINNQTVCQFRCDNGLCLFDKSMLCNTVNDCGDNSDETVPCNVSVNCSFTNSFLCGYQSSWKLISAPKDVFNSLPLFDHTLGNSQGKFLANFLPVGDTISRLIKIEKTHCLRFHYHIRGQIKNGLTVSVKYANDSFILYTPVLDLNYTTRPDLWLMVTANLSAGKHEVIFRAHEPQKSAIDDIMLLSGPCTKECIEGEFMCNTSGTRNCLPLAVQCNFVVDCDDASDEINCSAPAYWCDFENGNICGIHQDSDDTFITEWILTRSSLTPDHTFGNSSGHMLSLNTQQMLENDFVVMSQAIQLVPYEFCLRFYYASSSPATFIISLDWGNREKTLLRFSNRQTNNWTLAYVTIPSSLTIPASLKNQAVSLTYTVEGSELYTGSYSNLIMIDDISITRGRCPAFTCPDSMFLCVEEAYCIQSEKYCDRVIDCTYSTDEKDCDCNEDEFKCPNEMCIPKSKTCNLVKDCIDGSDEGAVCDNRRSVSCDFEDIFLCGYTSNTSRNTYHWARVMGDANGPVSDHTHFLNNQVHGYFVVADSSQSNSHTALSSVPFISKGNGLLFYYYANSVYHHFPTASEWRLSVVVIYSDSGEQEEIWHTLPTGSNTWLFECIMLPKGNISISFVAQRGVQHFKINFALDDVQLLTSSCDIFLAGNRIGPISSRPLAAPSITVSDCQVSERACRNGMCLKASLFCDGKQQCFDGSDEYNCPTT